MSQTPIDPALLRRVLGAFVTGVTVVTTRTAAGDPVGITVNSFNTVSLSPPLVLWSLSLRAASFDAFVRSSHFVVNVLGAHQIPLSERFATTGGDKFAGVAWRKALADMPLLDGTAASFTCRNAHRFPGGDHLIFVGEVVAFEQGECAPLVYANGGYAKLRDDFNAGRSGAESRNRVASR
ncbi:MAG TPA: flavin reductase family protein [Lysobacter sp.]|jgi:3-hydroxy-9,10-secoandrosta-1,3,5(10)-triene-9,17-dione monooxygenase reductase component|nr:flavin reductase family protein [Lysobacter sp.]